MPSKKFRVGPLVALVVSAVILTLAVWLVFNRQYAMDQVSVWAFKPTPTVQAMDQKINFTPQGTFYFYASHPVVADADDFNQNCPREEVGSPIIGCYAMYRIFIYNVTNEKLQGIEEVTAAHETLHAIWERTSESDKKHLEGLLKAAYDASASPELKERMDYYQRTEPGEFYNELHSILGTEVITLGSELETYYKKYFEDRTSVIALHDQYDSLFKQLSSDADTLFNELESLGGSIDARMITYNNNVNDLTSDIQSFNARAESNQFSSVAQFNSERAVLTARSNQLNNERAEINADITIYNQKYEQYQTIASQIELLNSSIDSFTTIQAEPTVQAL